MWGCARRQEKKEEKRSARAHSMSVPASQTSLHAGIPWRGRMPGRVAPPLAEQDAADASPQRKKESLGARTQTLPTLTLLTHNRTAGQAERPSADPDRTRRTTPAGTQRERRRPAFFSLFSACGCAFGECAGRGCQSENTLPYHSRLQFFLTSLNTPLLRAPHSQPWPSPSPSPPPWPPRYLPPAPASPPSRRSPPSPRSGE